MNEDEDVFEWVLNELCTSEEFTCLCVCVDSVRNPSSVSV